MNKDRCQTCKFWQVFPENNLAGRCPLLGVMLWPKVDDPRELVKEGTLGEAGSLRAEISITHSDPFHILAGGSPRSEAIAVRTQRDFGCINHTPKVG